MKTTQIIKLFPRDIPGGSDGKESAYNLGDSGSMPGLGRYAGGGSGNPIQYSFLPGDFVKISLMRSHEKRKTKTAQNPHI